MAKDEEKKPAPSFTFNKDVQAEVIGGDKIGEQFNAEGDQTVDKSQHQGETNIAGDMHGNIENTNTIVNHGDVMQAMDALESVLTEVAPPLPRQVPGAEEIAAELPDTATYGQGDLTDSPVETTLDEVLNDHPSQVFQEIRDLDAQTEPITEDQEKGLAARFGSMVTKYGNAAKGAFIPAAKLVVSGISATVSPAFPWNIVSSVLTTAVDHFSE